VGDAPALFAAFGASFRRSQRRVPREQVFSACLQIKGKEKGEGKKNLFHFDT
jgi:hypothetical protein